MRGLADGPHCRARANASRLAPVARRGRRADGRHGQHQRERRRIEVVFDPRRRGARVGAASRVSRSVLSGRPSEATSRRAAELGITHRRPGRPDKTQGYRRSPAAAWLRRRRGGVHGRRPARSAGARTRRPRRRRPPTRAGKCRQRVHWVSQYPRRPRRGARLHRAHAASARPVERHRQTAWRARCRTTSSSSASFSRCSSASRPARRGSATSSSKAAGSIGGGSGSRRTSSSA